MSYRTKVEAQGQRTLMGLLLAKPVSVVVAAGTYGKGGPAVPFVGKPLTAEVMAAFEPGPSIVTRVLDSGVLLQAVKAHAAAVYAKGKPGIWDFVHVSFGDDELSQAIGKAFTVPGAIQAVAKAAKVAAAAAAAARSAVLS